MTGLDALLDEIRRKWAPEPRHAVFEVRVDRRPDAVAFVGVTTEAAGAEDLLARATLLVDGRDVVDEIVRLPDPVLGDTCWAVVRGSVAPVHAAPDIRATQTTQYVLGTRVELLFAVERWVRVRGDDGYIGWVHRGYLEVGDAAWVADWDRADGRVPAVSFGAVLLDDDGAPAARLPWGARVAREPDGRVALPDGRRLRLGSGEVHDALSVSELYPAAGVPIARSALGWAGSPYVWGGVTMGGVDCSGLVQAVYRMHGIVLPRDAELQRAVGQPVGFADGLDALRPGDLLFFTEVPGRITHVALSLGGTRIVHSALANGGVADNDLAGTGDVEPRLREMLVDVRRVLPELSPAGS